MKNRTRTFLLTVIQFFCISIFCNAQTSISIPAAKDATIFSENSSGSNGAGDLFVGRTNQPANRRTLIQFDISGIPDGATIISAELTIRGSRQSTNTVNLHRLNQDWGEGTTNGSGNGGGQPDPANTGDATWSHSFFNNTTWNSAGGSFNSSTSASANVNNNQNAVWLGAGVISDVQNWVDGSETNFGWILIGDENQNNSAVRMVSREGESNTPMLTIIYAEPNTCNVDGGAISGGPFTFCVGDGVSDNIPQAEVSLTGNSGTNSQWVITNENGTIILGLPDILQDTDFDNAGAGICRLWHLSYENGLVGLVVNGNVNDLDGCFDFSDTSIEVIRNQPEGGSINSNGQTASIRACIINDVVQNFEIEVNGNSGANGRWVVSSLSDDTIVDIKDNPPFDFSNVAPGTARIEFISYEDGLSSLAIGEDRFSLVGCFDASNALLVFFDDLQGGMLSTLGFETDITICAGDGEPDPVFVILGENQGIQNWAITNDLGDILELPLSPPFDFEGAGEGVCRIYNISAPITFSLNVGQNVNQLPGCFAISNPITVTRVIAGAPCPAECTATGGTLSGEDVSFCVGDGIADNIPEGSITISGNSGSNTQWVVTNEDGIEILGLPGSPGAVDFDGSGVGTCKVWHLTYEDGLTGLNVNDLVDDLDGCFAFSENAITVFRRGSTSSEINITACEGDGFSLLVGTTTYDENNPMGTEVFENAFGCDSVVTISIEFIPPATEEVTYTGCIGDGFSVSVAGTIYDENNPTGTENLINSDGCDSIITVNLMFLNSSTETITYNGCTGDGFSVTVGTTTYDENNPSGTESLVAANGCDSIVTVDLVFAAPEGGNVTGGPFSFCVGDGLPDMIGTDDVTVSGNSGSNNQWVVTDEEGATILGLPGAPEDVDFDSAGAGTCLIWNLSYEEGLQGLEMGEDVADLVGCFDFSSNSITVIRSQPVGGTVNGEDFTFCVSDDMADHVLDVSVFDNSGTNSQWVVTNEDGTVILGLPEAPENVNFDGAGSGTCLIWHLSYEDGLTGLEMDANVADLQGCFSLSTNAITVTRSEEVSVCGEPPCEANAGELSGEDFTFCVGDGIADQVSGITVAGNLGANSQWVVTDQDGIVILGLPDSPEDVDFDGADEGVCLIWHLSYEDGLTGLQVDGIISDLNGCFSLSSNAITVIRETEGEFCEPAPEILSFQAILSGTQQNDPVLSTGKGIINGILEGNTFSISGEFSGLKGDFDAEIAGGAHIHKGVAGRNGGIEFSLTTAVSENLKSGSYEATDNTFVLTDEQIDALLSQEYYINIHTSEFPGGELRGQILPESDQYFQTRLLGSNQVPSIVSDGLGSIIFTLDDTTLTASGSFDDLSSTVATAIAGGAHIHNAMAGRNGDLVFPLDITFDTDTTGGVYEAANNTFNLAQDQIDELLSEGWYVNVHSEDIQSGELRGQIAPIACATFRADLAGSQQTPPVCTGADGRIMVNYDGNGMISVSGSFNNLESDVNFNAAGGMHIHSAPAGRSGGIAFPLTFDIDTSDNQNATINPADNNFELTDEQIDALLAREYYVNVHSVENGPGEIRGQLNPLAKTYLGTSLSGINAVQPVSSPGGGNLLFEINDDQVIVTGSFNGLEGDFDASIAGGSHLHIGDASSTGGVAVILNATADEELKSGTYEAENNTFVLSDEQIDALLNGEYYVNIHSTDFPSGELRGQILRDNNSFPAGGFNLNDPQDGATIFVGPDEIDTHAATWDSTTDPDGDDIVYIWEWSLDPDFVTPIHQENVGANLFKVFTGREIDSVLVASLDTIPDMSPLYMRTLASDGSVNKSSNTISVNIVPTGDICDVTGGNLIGGPFTFCVGDTVPDHIPFGEVMLSDDFGDTSIWVVTDESAETILGLPGVPSDVDFEGAGPGICLIWNLSYNGDLTGLEMGNMVSGLEGCFSLSDNAVIVTRITEGGVCDPVCDVGGGTITGGPYTFCVGDGEADNIPFGEVMLNDDFGDTSVWVVTDESAETILGLPGVPSDVDFEGAGPGICLIWNLSYSGDLTGLQIDSTIAGLEGCFSLSENYITVTRNQPLGGTLEGDEYNFCVEDGIADHVSEVTVSGNSGTNSQWVVTNHDGTIILGLPGAPEEVDFDGAGEGTCLIWHLSYENGLIGLEMDALIENLEGCFALSENYITVTRNQPLGGTLEGDEYNFCVGDGIADHVSEVTVSGNSGTNSQWVVTNHDGTIILGLPGAPEDVDFDGAGSGTCLIWHLSYENGLTGLEMDALIENLEGCYALSENYIEVVRVSGDDCPGACNVEAGTIELPSGATEYTICAGDGIPDRFTVRESESHENGYLAITNEEGMILAFPEDNRIDLEGAGTGICKMFKIVQSASAARPDLGEQIDALQGCHAISNAIVVTRITCDPVCQQPLNLRSRDLGSGRFEIRWDRVGSSRGYEIVLTPGDNPDRAIRVPVRRNRLRFSSSSLSSFTVKVRAICGTNLASDYTDELSLSLGKSGFINSFTDGTKIGDFIIYESDFVIAPNPAVDYIKVLYDTGEQNAVMSIYDFIGRKVNSQIFQGGTIDHRVDISSIPSGIYMMTIESQGFYVDKQQFVKSK